MDSFTISIMHYAAPTGLIVLQLVELPKWGLGLMHMDFAKDLMVLWVLIFCFGEDGVIAAFFGPS